MSHLRINYRPWETTKIGLFQENYQYSKEVAPTKKIGRPVRGVKYPEATVN